MHPVARILIITSGIQSIVNANVEMAQRLTKGGHTIIYGSRSGIGDFIEAQGLEFLQLDQLYQSKASNGDPVKPATMLGIHGFADRVMRYRPELMIIDIELSEYIFAARVTAVPVMLMSTFLSLWKRPGLPPLHTALVPGNGLTGSRISLEAAWAYFRMRKGLSRMAGKVRGKRNDKTALLRAFAKQHGVDFNASVDFNQWLIPFSYRRLPVLNLNALEFEFPHQPHSLCHFVGPMVSGHRNETFSPQDTQESVRLKRLVERFQKADDDARHLVYCAFGRFDVSYDETFLRRIIHVFRRHPEWELILSLGGCLDAGKLSGAPENVHIFEWVPQIELLSVADCAVIHAGISTINECIYHEVPMVTYSIDMRDQNGNAARVGYHGLGVVGNRDRDRVEVIARNIQEALECKKIRNNLFQLRRKVEKYAEENTVTAVVNSYISQYTNNSN